MRKPQTILITGSSSGFGQLIAQTLIANGHTVFATMRAPEGRNRNSTAQLRAYAAEHEGTLHILDLDVTDTKFGDYP